jgi:hypothetical protein
MFDVIEMIYLRLAKLFAKKGYVDASGEASVPEDNDCDVPMPFRPRAPKAYRRKGRILSNPLFQHPDPDMMSVQGWLNVRYKWFSLHAAVSIDGANRAGLFKTKYRQSKSHRQKISYHDFAEVGTRTRRGICSD